MNFEECTYWNNNGRYQDYVATVQKLCNTSMPKLSKNGGSKSAIVSILDCFLAMASIYHDVYNNGKGWNDHIMKQRLNEDIRPIMGSKFGNIARFYKDFKYLEQCMDKVILKVYTSDIKMLRSFSLITVNGNWYVTPSTKFIKGAEVYTSKHGECTFKDIQKYMKSKNAKFYDSILFSKRSRVSATI